MTKFSTSGLPFTVYLAPDGFVNELTHELGDAVREVHERLVIAEGAPRTVVWADNVWLNPRLIEVSSIGDAAQKLKMLQRNWANYAFNFHRRSQLIAEKLPHVSAKPIAFPSALPAAPLGGWTLLEPNLMLASPTCSSPYPNGVWNFVENKDEPPNRAYLKLWEALMRLQKFPKAGDACLDLGASPGGWTWVLQKLGANVIAVDKAPLALSISALPNIKSIQQSAFALEPKDVGEVDWLFSDIICYPNKTLQLIEKWIHIKNIISTIKFQGETDHATLAALLKISGSCAFHLYNNKHEITWARISNDI